MARFERGLNQDELPVPSGARERAAEAFLKKHSDLRSRLACNPGSDLYSTLATHISLHEVPERRSDLILSLREELVAQLGIQSPLAVDERRIEVVQFPSSHPEMNAIEPTHEAGPPASKAFTTPLDHMIGSTRSIAAELTQPRGNVGSDNHRAGSTHESERIYRHRGMQAYEDLMESIESLAVETVGAIATVEHLAANPHATDADFRASIVKVETLQRILGTSIVGLQSSIVDKLTEQFEREGIKLEPEKISNIAEKAIMDARVPRVLAFCANESRIFEQRYNQMLEERRKTVLKSEIKPDKSDTIEFGTSYDPRP